jgi:hypothetical protein
MLGRVLAGLLVSLGLLAAGTYVLGEIVPGGVLYTRDTEGAWVGTKLWVVERDGVPWVRVARPERAWYRRLRVDPNVELERDGVRTRHRAIPHPDAAARAALDAAFREQNGAIDWWYGVLLRSEPVPIELAHARGDGG